VKFFLHLFPLIPLESQPCTVINYKFHYTRGVLSALILQIKIKGEG
jgi:hypothetical protein